MKEKLVNIFWGIVLIVVSGILLARAMGYIDFDILSDQGWVLVFGVASAAFFFSYFLNGVKHWGWLFPAFIFAALGLTVWMAISGMTGSFLGAPILAAIALPFLVGFAVERKSWGLLIPGFILGVLALVTLLADSVRGEWIGALVQFSIGVPFLVAWLVNRKRRWALIPAFVMFVLAVVTMLSVFSAGEWIGAVILYAIGLPFLVIYLLDRSKRWALIPAVVMGVLGTLPLIAMLSGPEWSGFIIMLIFSAPFFVTYFLSKPNWWALIPAGIFASIALIVLLSIIIPNEDNRLTGLYNGVLLLGFAATFGVLWLQRKTHPTDWAKYPAIGLLVGSLFGVLLGRHFNDYWGASVMLVIGVILLYSALGRKKPAEVTPKPEE